MLFPSGFQTTGPGTLLGRGLFDNSNACFLVTSDFARVLFR